MNFTVTNLTNFVCIGLGTYPFAINKTPLPGSCLVSPSSGVALTTEFTISCPENFTDVDTPFTYQASYRFTGEPPGVVYTGKMINNC